jgi:type IV pilus assembly protein PilB
MPQVKTKEEHELLKILTDQKLLQADDITALKEESKKERKTIGALIFEKNLLSEKALYEAKAKYYNLPFVELNGKTIRKDILDIVPEPIASTHQVVAFDQTAEQISLATLDPQDLETFEFLKKKTGQELKIHLTSPDSIRDVLKQYHKSLQAEFEDITQTKEIVDEGSSEKLKELASDLPLIKIVDTLLEYAIFEGASDIHIEPLEKEVIVRYRIDGILKDVMNLPKKTQTGLVARLKILSNLKLDEHRLPQDGRFKIATPEYKISFRVSIIPIFDGEKVVLRLLNESTQMLTLEQLGLEQNALAIVKKNTEKPHGMILVTGPTGSGKTTTLYTILNILNTREVNIVTIEDPIEYRMARVNQSQINPKIGFTFAAGLRSFLRQDPDIIMVGEIRDTETAEIAINAAMTGHLVLSTLHTNDAATTLPRLQDMHVPSFLIASSTNVIIAQRLVRKICSKCKISYNLDKKALADIEKHFDIGALIKKFSDEGIIDSKEKISNLKFYKGKGCNQCGSNGYKGRIGIYEVLEITESIAQLVMRKASSDEIMQEATEKNNMMPLLQDGFVKAKNGITTLEEVFRVTQE